MKSYKINGQNCGRDKNGVFHCVCGKCKETDSAAKGDDCRDGCNDGCNCRNGGKDRVYDKPVSVGALS